LLLIKLIKLIFLDSNIVVPRRSGWSFTLFIIGWLLFALALGCGFVFYEARSSERGTYLVGVIAGLAGGLQALLFGFLIDVFTDIRWYLQKMANKDS
jgi:hypothetical protein